jgi:hypothetical protein
MMALSDLIHKNKSKPIVTSTVATPATRSSQIGETVANVASVAVANPSEPKIDDIDDRHFCRECLNIRNGYCTKQRFRPVDDIPRRCEDFKGYLPIIDHRGERKTSEAEHNAQGRFFKFLVTRPDGTQYYSCTMPRQTLEEAQAQYPEAAAIEPVTGEDYGDEG